MATSREIYRKFWNASIPKGWHIHHIDGDSENDDPYNLTCIPPELHWLIHFCQGDPVAINGKFVQGASEAGRKGGTISGKKHPRSHFQMMGEKGGRVGGPKVASMIFTSEHQSKAGKAAIVAMTARGSHSWQKGTAGFQQKGVATSAGAIGRKKAVVNGNNFFQRMSFVERSSAGKKGGSVSGPKVAAKYFTPEWQSQAGKAANIAMLARRSHSSQRGTAGFQQKGLASKAGRIQAQLKHKCPHCGKIGKSNSMFQHHFDRCRYAIY